LARNDGKLKVMTDDSWSGLSGVSLAISADREVHRVAGVADRAAGLNWTLQTQSQVSSISKQFVAACALMLVDAGVLQFDESVGRHLGAGDSAWDAVSVQDLMTHTAGMSHWNDEPGFTPTTPLAPADRLELLLAGRLSRPGAEFHYSSPGYIVLSAVLADAADCSYAELAQELIIEPLGLADTTMGLPKPGPAAHGYARGEPVQLWDLSGMPGTGDVWSTAEDIARFILALHGGDLLPSAAQPMLHQIKVPCSSGGSRIRVHSYAVGHFVGMIDNDLAYLHPGDNPGYQSLAVWLPDTSTAAVVLSNDEATDIESTMLEILEEIGRDR
jgi:CubicO group peptidase (beta-lactamase class C family)